MFSPGAFHLERLVESRAGIILRPSLLDLDVPVSVHPAPDVSGFCLAHVFIIVATFMYCYKIVVFPIIVISIYMM